MLSDLPCYCSMSVLLQETELSIDTRSFNISLRTCISTTIKINYATRCHSQDTPAKISKSNRTHDPFIREHISTRQGAQLRNFAIKIYVILLSFH
jgi:hypothetical protein